MREIRHEAATIIIIAVLAVFIASTLISLTKYPAVIETSTAFTLAAQDTEYTCQIIQGEGDGAFTLNCLDGAE